MPLTADGQGKLVGCYNNIDFFVFLIDFHAFDFRRSEGVTGVGFNFFAIADNIDLFSMEFVDDGLNPTPTHAHTCTDWIDFIIRGIDRNFCPLPGFPGGMYNFDDAIKNFRNFHFEHLDQQTGMGSRNGQLRSFLWVVIDIQQKDTDVVTKSELLPLDLLPAEKVGFRPVHKVDGNPTVGFCP